MQQTTPDMSSSQWTQQTRRIVRRWFWLPLLLGAVLAIGAALVWEQTSPDRMAAFFGTLDDVDLEQARIDTALPIPRGETTLMQDFVPHRDGLREIELTLVRQGEPAPNENGRFTLQLFDTLGTVVASQNLETRNLTHNQIYRFTFAPQANSAGQRYVLRLSGNADNPVTAWGYRLDVYADGQATVESGPLAQTTTATAVQDMRFLTRYRLTWADALRTLATTLYYEGALLLLALLVVPLPGCLLLLILRRQEQRASDAAGLQWDGAAWVGTAVALGAAAWPLVWLWWSLPARWWGWLLWLVLVAGWLATGWMVWQNRRRATRLRPDAGEPWSRRLWRSLRWEHAVLLLIIMAGVAVRLVAVRDVSFPLWVDASRHGLITEVMVGNGRVITSYAPLLPVDRFPYHFGFHTLAATLRLMSDWPLERLLLYVGQLLNGLVPLTVYTAVWLTTRRRGAGLFAAFLVALPFFFPAYYATWGRMTQLTGVLVLPVLLGLSWQLMRGGDAWRRVWWLVAVLASGLFLIHFRVFVFYLPFAALVWFVSAGRRTRWLLAAAGLTLLLLVPRLVTLWLDTDPARQLTRTIPNYNEFPTNYLTTGWEEWFAWLAAVGVALTLAGAVLRRRWATLPLVLAAWVAVLFLLLSGDRLGLPQTALVNLNSMYIMLFVPLAIFLAALAGQLMTWIRVQHWLLQLLAYGLAGAALGAAFLFGIRQQIGILNAQTILAQTDDLPAIAWVDASLPADAKLAVSSWQWLGNTWAAADGGAWLLPLTGRATTTPPIDYIYNPDYFAEIRAFNEAATAVTDWSDPAQVAWLRAQGVTHIYVGVRGGFFDPAALARNPEARMIYGHAGAFVFDIRE